jgi:small subunit ribosomal protein S8
MVLDSNDILIRLKYRSKNLYVGKTKESCITNLKRISKPGLRVYTNHREIPRILGGTGIVILSTPCGILTDREARLKGVGGELLCSIW